MTSLEDAWEWYQAAREGMRRLTQLSKHWGQLPWGGEDGWVRALARDGVLRDVEADQLAADAKRVRDELDDLAVLVLFSVFEAALRGEVRAQLRPEVDQLRHAALRRAAEGLLDTLGEGSFFQVLELFKSAAANDLIEQVNQVRRFRNWVAHGRRGEKPAAEVDPKTAYDRLREFLRLVTAAEPGLEPTDS